MVNIKIKIKEYLPYIVGFLLILAVCLSIWNYYQTRGEWTCIAQECVEFSRGDNWVEDNCKFRDGEMMCEFKIDEENYRVPLTQINASKMVSCRKMECSVEVYLRKSK